MFTRMEITRIALHFCVVCCLVDSNLALLIGDNKLLSDLPVDTDELTDQAALNNLRVLSTCTAQSASAAPIKAAFEIFFGSLADYQEASSPSDITNGSAQALAPQGVANQRVQTMVITTQSALAASPCLEPLTTSDVLVGPFQLNQLLDIFADDLQNSKTCPDKTVSVIDIAQEIYLDALRTFTTAIEAVHDTGSSNFFNSDFQYVFRQVSNICLTLTGGVANLVFAIAQNLMGVQGGPTCDDLKSMAIQIISEAKMINGAAYNLTLIAEPKFSSVY